MRRTTILTTLILVLASLVAPGSPAKEIVEIRMLGHFYSAPATVEITVAVEPGAGNSMLIVEADSENYFRSSSIELDGEKEKRFHAVEFKSLPAGEYELRAEVRSRHDVLGKATGELVVTGSGAER